jgi:hypothetical protein
LSTHCEARHNLPVRYAILYRVNSQEKTCLIIQGGYILCIVQGGVYHVSYREGHAHIGTPPCKVHTVYIYGVSYREEQAVAHLPPDLLELRFVDRFRLVRRLQQHLCSGARARELEHSYRVHAPTHTVPRSTQHLYLRALQIVPADVYWDSARLNLRNNPYWKAAC